MLLWVLQFIHINVTAALAWFLTIVNHLVPFLFFSLLLFFCPQAWFTKHWGLCHSTLAGRHMAQLMFQPQ